MTTENTFLVFPEISQFCNEKSYDGQLARNFYCFLAEMLLSVENIFW